MYRSVLLYEVLSSLLRLLPFVVHGQYIIMYSSVFAGRLAKHLHNAYNYSCLSSKGGGMGDFR